VEEHEVAIAEADDLEGPDLGEADPDAPGRGRVEQDDDAGAARVLQAVHAPRLGPYIHRLRAGAPSRADGAEDDVVRQGAVAAEEALRDEIDYVCGERRPCATCLPRLPLSQVVMAAAQASDLRFFLPIAYRPHSRHGFLVPVDRLDRSDPPRCRSVLDRKISVFQFQGMWN
jgi:ferredoxin